MRAVDGPAADGQPVAAVDGVSDEGDDSTNPPFAVTARQNTAADGANGNNFKSVVLPMKLRHPGPFDSRNDPYVDKERMRLGQLEPTSTIKTRRRAPLTRARPNAQINQRQSPGNKKLRSP